MDKLKNPWLWLVATLIGICLISERSGYSIRGDVKTIDLEIAMMLSPWGLLNNLVLVKDHYLQPYYLQATERGALSTDPTMAVILVATAACALGGLFALRRKS